MKEALIEVKRTWNLLFKSVEEGVHGLLYSQIKDVVPSVTEASSSLNSKINFLIKSQLPLITIEQLKIHEINNKFNKEIDINALRKLEKLKAS